MSIFTLPYPPSTNSLFINRKGGRYRSPKYEEWIIRASTWLREQIKTEQDKPEYPVMVRLIIGVQDNRAKDIDNRIKPVMDLLVKCGVLIDDSSKYVRMITAQWTTEHTGVQVSIESMNVGAV